jgi:hypothetical protein
VTKGDLYKTPANQHRFVLGHTATGEVAFATRGGNPLPDYNSCQIQPQDTFLAESSFVKRESAQETTRVTEMFANYMSAKGVT